MTDTNWFERLNALNVNDKIEKKNGFSYLSWAWAHARMAELDPDFDWWPHEFNGLPYLETPGGCFVKVTVKFKGRERTHLFPVLDHRNKPIQTPTVFDINTSIMRAMVKCCALFGLGLYIYAGEDMPEDAGETQPTPRQRNFAKEFADAFMAALSADVDEDEKAARIVALRDEASEDKEVFTAAWKMLSSADRTAIKAYIDAYKRKAA